MSNCPIVTVVVSPEVYLAHHWGREMVFESCIPLHSLPRASDPARPLKHLVRTAVRKYAELCGFWGRGYMTSTKVEWAIDELT